MSIRRVLLALVVVAALRSTSRAEPCPPRAELGGDAEAVAKVALELKRLGVDASVDPLHRPEAACPAIVAAVELDRGGRIAVAVRDAARRSEGRVVSDAALAAAWIDSWLQDDFTGPPAPGAPPASLPVEPQRPVTPQTSIVDRVMVAASYLQIWSEDRTWSSGVAASACVLSEGVCLGGRLAYDHRDVTADLSAASKTDLSLLATVSYSETVGRMSIAPELGLGVGRITTSRIEGCKVAMTPPNCDPTTDPMCVAPQPPGACADPAGTTSSSVYVGDHFSETTYTPRISAAVRIAIPLFDHVWLDGLAGATIAPFGHPSEYAAKAADGTTDPNTMNGAVFPLPGDTTFGLQLGVGVRVGAP